MDSIRNINVSLHVVETLIDINRLTTFTLGSSSVGREFSSREEILVNSVDDGYSILIDSEVFNNLDMYILGKNVLAILMDNLANCRINLTIYYHFRIYEDELDISGLNMETASNFISLHDIFAKIKDNNDPIFVKANQVLSYRTSQSVLDTCNIYINIYYKNRTRTEEAKADAITTLRNSDYMDDPSDYFRNIIMLDDDDDDERKKSKKKSSKKKSKVDVKKREYPASKVMKSCKSPKKAYKRHGVLVCKDKSAINKDEKVIKEFIKDFFPGKAEWKKKFRKDLLSRWMNTYVISAKELKKVEKRMRNDLKDSQNRRRRIYGVSKALDMTSRLMTTPIDQWNDPRR